MTVICHNCGRDFEGVTLEVDSFCARCGANILVNPRRKVTMSEPEPTFLSMESNGCVAAGATCFITARPQTEALRPYKLYIHPEIAERFTIQDIRVGCRSMFPQAQNLDASQFSHGDGHPFACETILCAQDFVMVVTNIAGCVTMFRASWACRTPDFRLTSALQEQLSALQKQDLNRSYGPFGLGEPKPERGIFNLHEPNNNVYQLGDGFETIHGECPKEKEMIGIKWNHREGQVPEGDKKLLRAIITRYVNIGTRVAALPAQLGPVWKVVGTNVLRRQLFFLGAPDQWDEVGFLTDDPNKAGFPAEPYDGKLDYVEQPRKPKTEVREVPNFGWDPGYGDD